MAIRSHHPRREAVDRHVARTGVGNQISVAHVAHAVHADQASRTEGRSYRDKTLRLAKHG
ncbi:hypothetical protein CBOM_07665 [Ceraceosorus bombacis]|uniref:Uncharacterized protein n=1 Tax=Ceraceosorus bombacis TaxID=401625 RepID=A0A0P1BNI8_9BASI|nr:hypothetical protein CBOM_07665 [Ceraceosorus bombacis]